VENQDKREEGENTLNHVLINYVDDNAFLKHLLEPPLEQRLRMFSVVLYAVFLISQLSVKECI
jgi:hypothetical protein